MGHQPWATSPGPPALPGQPPGRASRALRPGGRNPGDLGQLADLDAAPVHQVRAALGQRGTLRGSSGVFSYQAPANSLTVIRVAR